MAEAAESTSPKVETREVNPERIVESPFHHRVNWGDQVAFAASIRQHGIIEPPVCRLVPRADGMGTEVQLVAGAKRVRGAIEVGLSRILIVLHRELSDRAAIDIQVEENLQRDGIHPLDESDYMHDLIALGVDKGAIAKRFKCTKQRVDQRLRLRELADIVRKAYGKGEIDDAQAAHISKLAVKDQQIAVLGAIRSGALGDANDVAAYIREFFLLPLTDVPWPLEDASVPGGACTKCPKRTGTQRELFEDLAGPADLCADSACYRGKMDHAWKLAVELAPSIHVGGARVLDDVSPADVFVPGGGGVPAVTRSSGYVEATAPCPTVPGRSWFDAAQDAGGSPVILLIQDQDGRPRMLLDETDVKKLVRKAARDEESPVALARVAADPAIAEAKERQRSARAEVKAMAAALICAPDGPTQEQLAAVVRLAMDDVVSASSNRAVGETLGVDVDFIVPAGKTPERELLVSILAALVVVECGGKRPASAALRDLARATGVEIAT